jgi:drug/metabolite transporter (DMT)-like permease
MYTLLCIAAYMIAAVLFGFELKATNSPGVSTALISLSPIITMVCTMLFLSEKITIYKIIAFGLAIASAVIVNF